MLQDKWLLHFKNTNWLSKFLLSLALFGFISSPLWLNTLSTGAELAGTEKTLSSKGYMTRKESFDFTWSFSIWPGSRPRPEIFCPRGVEDSPRGPHQPSLPIYSTNIFQQIGIIFQSFGISDNRVSNFRWTNQKRGYSHYTVPPPPEVCSCDCSHCGVNLVDFTWYNGRYWLAEMELS